MGSLARHCVMVELRKGMSLSGDLLNKYQSCAQVHSWDTTSWEVGLSQALGMGSCVPGSAGSTWAAGMHYQGRYQISLQRLNRILQVEKRRSHCWQVISSPHLLLKGFASSGGADWHCLGSPCSSWSGGRERTQPSTCYSPQKARKWHQCF